MHRHRADEEQRATPIIQCVRHYRGERVASVTTRHGRQCPGTAQMSQCAGALRKRRFGNDWRIGGSRRAGVAIHWLLAYRGSQPHGLPRTYSLVAVNGQI